MNNSKSISLYIHIPWCRKRCYYCDLHTYKLQNSFLHKIYIKNLLKDLEQDILLFNLKKSRIRTVFIGGGTPSLVSEKLIKFLMHEISKRIEIQKNAEITIEIHPKDVNYKKIYSYLSSGINRISFGMQSTYKNQLNLIDRSYNFHMINNFLKIIKDCGFKNINLDIMYALPNQNLNLAIEDLKNSISLQTNHISWYRFTVSENTMKKKNISEDTAIEISNVGEKFLEENGYKKYEISSYAKNTQNQCLHNLNYWNFGDYIGIGCGAHGKITKNKKIYRTEKNKVLNKYMKNNFIKKIITLQEKDIIIEFFMNKFRINSLIQKQEFFDKTGINPKKLKPCITKSIKKKYLIEKNKFWKVTKMGKNFLDNLLELFLV
ncbi:hypothetical protein AOQ89_01520 [bacterium endosymbiont of Pedicinus badii]|nr:hypothetical protein AOQ89_01520 [bacterium endosymbiont of Pedicinus badii]